MKSRQHQVSTYNDKSYNIDGNTDGQLPAKDR